MPQKMLGKAKELQWGRVLMGPETSYDFYTPTDDTPLQWGRVLMGPETIRSKSVGVFDIWLQWGRVLMGPETRGGTQGAARRPCALQWGRVLMGPETINTLAAYVTAINASMGPGPDGPGDPSAEIGKRRFFSSFNGAGS